MRYPPTFYEPISMMTESAASRFLAARIPPELFDDILFYVNLNRVSQRKIQALTSNHLERRGRERNPMDVLADLKRCSLVSLFWANKCREHMFSERILDIQSYEDAEIFRRYVVGGCPRLTPVHRIIKLISVLHDYSTGRERQTSFLHLLFIPVIQDKLGDLLIRGPITNGFNPAKLDTPHWGIPPSAAAQGSFLQNRVTLIHLHLPSFYHVKKYIGHFSCATEICFSGITWDGDVPSSLPRTFDVVKHRLKPRSMTISVDRCTDAFHLALTALMLNRNGPLHQLSDEERVWMIRFMTLLWGDKPDPDVHIGFNILEQATTMELDPFYFVFGEASASTDRSVSALSVVGIHAYIWSDRSIRGKLPANFDALVNHARTQPTIRALVLLFNSFALLQESLKHFLEVLTLASETIELVLAYEQEEDRKAVGVDLVTLEPNDRTDIWINEQSKRYWGGHLSLQMLQRRLKKKRWISVH